MVLDFAHLHLGFLRVYGNREVYQRDKKKFILLPILLYLCLLSSPQVLMIALSLAVVWDLWHVPMQNFGISRMLSSDVQLKRTSIPLNSRLEKIFHITILRGSFASSNTSDFCPNFWRFITFNLAKVGGSSCPIWRIGAVWLMVFKHWCEWSDSSCHDRFPISFFFFTSGLYLLHGLIFRRRGFHYREFFLFQLWCSWTILLLHNEVLLFLAYFILLHALQYFYLLWQKESENLFSRLPIFFRNRFPQNRVNALWLVFFPFLLFIGVFLFFMESYPWNHFFLSVYTTTRIMHFYFDGIIWSQRNHYS